jgi:nucleoside recognition membrane protein YjiH
VFFLVPVTWEGQLTVPFDIATSWVTATFPTLASVFSLALITAAGVLSVVAEVRRRGVSIGGSLARRIDLSYWETTPLFMLFRVLGVVLAVPLFLGVGPDVLLQDSVGGLVWSVIVLSVAIIIPIGALFVNLLVELGGLGFIGALTRPLMRPLFRLPGRAALDSIASTIGAFTVGYYVTYNVFHRGAYHKRDVFIIATCFAPVSIGYIGVIASTLDLLQVFPIVILAWLIAITLSGIVLVRIPPLTNIPTEYVVEPTPETPFTGSLTDYIRFAFSEALHEAKDDRIVPTAITGFIDGLKVAALILGTVVTISIAALLLIAQTDVFQIIAAPFAPVLAAFGIPDPGLATAAILISGVEQVSAATVVVNTSVVTRFFVMIVVSSQIIFFAASAPMMMDMFDNVPIRFRDVIMLFVLRTAVLIPIVAGLTHAVNYLGLLS